MAKFAWDKPAEARHHVRAVFREDIVVPSIDTVVATYVDRHSPHRYGTPPFDEAWGLDARERWLDGGDSMRLFNSGFILMLCVTAFAAGCFAPDKPAQEPLLNPPRVAPNSVDLDVFFITLPEQAAEVTFESAWQQADAQQISPEVRQRQYQNGLRAGVLGWRLPGEIQQMIESQSQPLQDPNAQLGGQFQNMPGNMMTPMDLEKMDRVSIRRIVALPGKRAEVIISREFQEFPLLLVEDGKLSGGNYEQAQGIFAVTARPVPGGKVRLEVNPELQYGELRRNENTAPGIIKLMMAREKVALDQMAFACDLSPGEFVVIGTQPGRPGSVGDRFFEDNTAGTPRRKLLLIRLARSPGSELFGDFPTVAQ